MSRELINVPPSSEAMTIYEAYPRKVARYIAVAAIQKAIKRHGYEHLLKRTREYAAAFEGSGKSLQFIPYPATFFNQEQFNDDFSAIFPASQPAQTPLPVRIKSIQGLITKIDSELRAIPSYAPSVFPKEHKAADAKRQPLLKRKAELKQQLEALNQQNV
jgi:hypothetical protein